MNKKQFDFQAWLQGVANQLGNEFVEIIDESDPEILKIVQEAWKAGRPKTPKEYDRWMDGIRKKIVAVRSKAISDATKMVVGQSEKVAKHASEETKQEIRDLSDRTEERIRSKSKVAQLTPKQLDDVLKYSPFGGRTIGDWMSGYESGDISRIMQGIQQGFTSGHSLTSMIRMIRGTEENRFADGILDTSRSEARRIARTITNGVSNAARLEMYKENADVIDGIKFSAAFDSKTCLLCGVEDGKIWGTDELNKVRVPPLHPNCRCAIVPYIDLGEEFAGERAVEVRDFEKDARDAHDANPKAQKSWDELSYDTRQSLRYKAMREYENVHGKGTAYRRVNADKSFKDIFDTQPAQFQKSWLGQKRYDAYKAGKLTLDQMVSPDTGYVRTIKNLGLSDASQTPGKSTAELEAERKQKEEEARRQIEEEKKRLEEERRRLEEEKKQLEEQKRMIEEAEKQRKEEEKRLKREAIEKALAALEPDDESLFEAFANIDQGTLDNMGLADATYTASEKVDPLEYNQSSREFFVQLTDEQKEAIIEYALDAYTDVNRALREQEKPDKETKRLIKEIKSAFKVYKTEKETVVFRGAGDLDAIMKGAKPEKDEEIVFEGFVSTSISELGAFSGASKGSAFFILRLPKGTPALPLGTKHLAPYVDSEIEMLLNHETTVRITKVWDSMTGGKIIEATVVNKNKKKQG